MNSTLVCLGNSTIVTKFCRIPNFPWNKMYKFDFAVVSTKLWINFGILKIQVWIRFFCQQGLFHFKDLSVRGIVDCVASAHVYQKYLWHGNVQLYLCWQEITSLTKNFTNISFYCASRKISVTATKFYKFWKSYTHLNVNISSTKFAQRQVQLRSSKRNQRRNVFGIWAMAVFVETESKDGEIF